MFLKSKINIDLFYNIQLPEIAYFLGFFWADGYIYKSKQWNSTICSIEIQDNDFQEIKKCLQLLGNWNFRLKKSKINSKKLFSKAYSADKDLYYFLLENDFDKKSGASPDKILSKIPEHLKHYFFRGINDGDGCIFVNHSNRSIIIAGSYNQDWGIFKLLCKQLNIFYRIKKRRTLRNNKIHKSSYFLISTTYDILIFGNYIYKNIKDNPLGLTRKYNKFLEIVELSKKMKEIKAATRDSKGNIILKDLTGRKFNKLTVIKRAKGNKYGSCKWICQCDCKDKTRTMVSGYSLKSGKTKSCGCYINIEWRKRMAHIMREHNTTHGDSKTKLYGIWFRMIYRHSNPKSERYNNKNIIMIQPEWKNYETFRDEQKQIYDELKLKYVNQLYFIRKDKSLGFVRGNCFWSTNSNTIKNIN